MLYQAENPHGGDIYESEIELDFSANTNPFGTPQGILDAVRESLNNIHCYPDPYCRKLIQAIALHEQLPSEYILCGNGAAELIYSYCEALQPRQALEAAPTFSEYSHGLELVNCTVTRYALACGKDFVLDPGFLSAIKNQKPDVVFLCNPNNPTGKLIPRDLLRSIADQCEELGIFLFIDECFLDLADRQESLKDLLPDHPHLLLLKAFTKSYGMAGLRLGYCLTSNTDLLRRMSRTVQPWNISIPAQAAGVAALREDRFLKETRNYIRAERGWLMEELQHLGFSVCSSEANYLLFQGPEDLHTRLKEYGILIRSCANYHNLGPGWYRIAVKLGRKNQQLIETLKGICADAQNSL